MQRRTLLAGTAAALSAGLAGCAGEDSADEETSTPDEETPTPTPEPDPDAAWTDGDGLDVEELEQAHVEGVMEAGSYTVRSVADTSHAGEERPDDWIFSQTIESRFDAESELQTFRHEITEADETSEAYVTFDRVYIRQAVGGEVQYDIDDHDRTSEEFRQAMEGEARTGILGLMDWELAYAEPVEVAGRTAFRYEADTYTSDREIPAEIETASAAVVVDERGIVHRIEQTFEGVHEGQEADVAITISYEDVGGTTIEEPDWLEEAEEHADG